MSNNQTLYIILIRDEANGGWTDQIGENTPRAFHECQNDIDALQRLADWSFDDDDYRIEAVDEDGGIKDRSIQVYS